MRPTMGSSKDQLKLWVSTFEPEITILFAKENNLITVITELEKFYIYL